MSLQMGFPGLQRALLGLLLCLGSFLASAGPVDCGNKPIRLAFFDFGYFYYENEGQSYGVDKDLVDELIKVTACKFATQVMPRARVFADLQSGDLDIGTAAIRTPERDRFAWFVPYVATKNFAILKGAGDSSFLDADAFVKDGKLQFGVVRGFRHGPEIDNFLAQMRQAGRVEESTSPGLLFDKFKQGRIDGMFSSPPIYRKYLKDLNMESQVVIRNWFPRDKGILGELMLAKTRFSEVEAGRWNVILRTMQRDGTLEKIYMRYMPAEAKSLIDF